MHISLIISFETVRILFLCITFSSIRTDDLFLLYKEDSCCVYSSRPENHNNYTIKVANGEENNRLLEKEVQFYTMLDRYNLPKLYHFFIDKNNCLTLYIECHDSNLKYFLEKIGEKISFDFKLAISKMLIDALYYLHSKNILHNDIKMENVWIKGNKILLSGFECLTKQDFKSVGSYKKKSESQEYVAPKVIKNNKLYFAADIYSLGKLMKQIFNFKNIKYFGPEKDERVIQMDSIFDGMMDHFPENRDSLETVMGFDIFSVFYSFVFCFCKQKDINFESVNGKFIKKGNTLINIFINRKIIIICSCSEQKPMRTSIRRKMHSMVKNIKVWRKTKIFDKKNITVSINGVSKPIYFLSLDELNDVELIFLRFKKFWNIK
ncbi:protein kinase [Hamiltosporidium magnivora]|uniref:Protein kinase n=1 Tax=Hamiltosporidium magnivora TaxID=148818 RepID=A0A4Q9KX72_9MICR|nr:protein kinase [Hamiltosporidium magnivora]